MIDFIIYFIIALGVLIFVHELGHFLIAKKAGIRVERFSLGYPPKMFGVQYGETEYCVSWIPFGGYVKVAGMADVGAEETDGAPWEFPSKPIWVRMGVIAAGPFMNFVFAFFALVFLFLVYGIDTVENPIIEPAEDSASATAGLQKGDHILAIDGQQVGNSYQIFAGLQATAGRGARLEIERDGKVLTVALPASEEGGYGLQLLRPTTVGYLVPDMPAEILLQEGDRITMVAGKPVHSWSEMSAEIRRHPGEPIQLVWARHGRLMQAEITPAALTKGGETFGQIGIGLPVVRQEVGLENAVMLAAEGVYNSSWLILDFLKELLQGLRSTKELGGPLRIAQLAGETGKKGPDHYIPFLAMLSVNLAIINLLPIPVLDGGHLIFLILEAIRRRPLSLRQREVVQQIGLVIMLFIMVLVTFNDLNQMVFHHIIELFQ